MYYLYERFYTFFSVHKFTIFMNIYESYRCLGIFVNFFLKIIKFKYTFTRFFASNSETDLEYLLENLKVKGFITKIWSRLTLLTQNYHCKYY